MPDKELQLYDDRKSAQEKFSRMPAATREFPQAMRQRYGPVAFEQHESLDVEETICPCMETTPLCRSAAQAGGVIATADERLDERHSEQDATARSPES